jgi:hypothetical protein
LLKNVFKNPDIEKHGRNQNSNHSVAQP